MRGYGSSQGFISKAAESIVHLPVTERKLLSLSSGSLQIYHNNITKWSCPVK
jgi:hypothetical protein